MRGGGGGGYREERRVVICVSPGFYVTHVPEWWMMVQKTKTVCSG